MPISCSCPVAGASCWLGPDGERDVRRCYELQVRGRARMLLRLVVDTGPVRRARCLWDPRVHADSSRRPHRCVGNARTATSTRMAGTTIFIVQYSRIQSRNQERTGWLCSNIGSPQPPVAPAPGPRIPGSAPPFHPLPAAQRRACRPERGRRRLGRSRLDAVAGTDGIGRASEGMTSTLRHPLP